MLIKTAGMIYDRKKHVLGVCFTVFGYATGAAGCINVVAGLFYLTGTVSDRLYASTPLFLLTAAVSLICVFMIGPGLRAEAREGPTW